MIIAAYIAIGFIIFCAGIATGILALRAELRRNGWAIHIQVDDAV